ncbi:MAG: NAD-dependent epimerase/dehydratase family protein [Chitinophagaceae bacterium]|jgi:dihydroflavonol-4-reductase
MILVTGANGLVGQHLISYLLQQGKKVRATFHTSKPTIVHPNLEWIQTDILDVEEVEVALTNITQVYHCAAVVSFHKSQQQSLLKINVEGTANIVNACIDANIEKLVFVSSVAALGRIRENETIHEGMKWTPETSNSTYGKSKYLAEMEVWRGIGEGLPAVIVNPSIILGAANWNGGSAGIFKSAYNEFPWYTTGVSGFVDVMDVVKAMVLLMDSTIVGERFIVSAENTSYQHIFSSIAKGFGKKPPYKKVTPLLASIVWRVEAIKAFFTGKKPLLTKETAATAQAKVYFDNNKLLQYLPEFTYTPIAISIDRICKEFIKMYHLQS